MKIKMANKTKTTDKKSELERRIEKTVGFGACQKYGDKMSVKETKDLIEYCVYRGETGNIWNLH